MSRRASSPTFASIALAPALLELRIMRLREASVGSSRTSFPRSACTKAPRKRVGEGQGSDAVGRVSAPATTRA